MSCLTLQMTPLVVSQGTLRFFDHGYTWLWQTSSLNRPLKITTIADSCSLFNILKRPFSPLLETVSHAPSQPTPLVFVGLIVWHPGGRIYQ